MIFNNFTSRSLVWANSSASFNKRRTMSIPRSKYSLLHPSSPLPMRKPNITQLFDPLIPSSSSRMTSTTMNFGSYFGSSPRTPQWVTNLRGLLPLFTRPRSTKLMTSNFELSKNGSPTSLVPSTSSFTRYGNWKQRGTLTTNSQTCASPLPSSCASSWPAWQAGFPPFGQRTFEQLKALRTRTTHSNWWTQSNFKMTSSPTRLFHRPSNPDSLLALNPDSQATIITTAFKLRTDRTDRRRTRSSDAATITATTSLIFNGTTTNDGGTGNSGEEARAATTNLATDETSRRATSTILRRMASYYKRPQHPRRREGLQDTVPASSPGVTITSSNSPMVSGSDGGHGQRSVRFDGQGGDRVRKWARLYKSSLYHPQENGRTSSSPQPQSTESVPSFQTLQNGNHPTCLSTNKPGRLFDIYRPARRFPTRTDASVFSKVPSVSMAGPALSIQSPPVRPLLSPTSLHQGSPPSPAMGAQQGDTDIGLPGRFDHRGSDEGALVRGNEVSAQQTRALGVSGQGIQVQPHPINDSATPGLRDRHRLHVLEGPRTEDSGSSSRSIQTDQQDNLHHSPTRLVHRQSSSNDSGSLPSTPQGPASTSGQDSSTEIGSILERLDIHSARSNSRTSLVAHQPPAMERTVLDCSESTSRHLYRRVQFRLGGGDQQQVSQRNLEHTTTVSPHQLQGVVDRIHRLEETLSSGTHSQHHLGQCDNNRLHQPLRRDEITGTDATGNNIMELVPFNRDADQDDIRTLSIQPSRRAIPTPHRTTRVGNRSQVLSKTRPAMGPPPRRSLRIADQPPSSSIHDLEAVGRRRRTRRVTAPVETVGQRLSVPAVEPYLASSSKKSNRRR